MTLKEAFKHQLETTRLLIEDDLNGPDNPIYPVVWNGVIFRPNGNHYSSGREMKVGDKLVVGYVIETTEKVTDTPTPILFEESELDENESKFRVIRTYDNVPVLEYVS